MPRFNAPAPPLVGDAIRLSIQTKAFGRTPLNVLDYIVTVGSPITGGSFALFLAAWRTANEANLTGCLSSSATIVQYTVSTPSRDDLPSLVTTVTVPGTIVAPPLTSFVATHGTKKSTLKGQHGRGRVSWPWLPDTFYSPGTDPNQLNATGITAFAALNASLNAGVTWSGPSTALPAILTRPIPPATLVTNGVQGIVYGTNPFFIPARTREEYRIP